MSASSVTSLNSIGDVVSGRYARMRSWISAVRPSNVYASVGTVTTTSVFTKITFDQVRRDPLKAWSTANNNYKIGLAGVYCFSTAVTMPAYTAGAVGSFGGLGLHVTVAGVTTISRRGMQLTFGSTGVTAYVLQATWALYCKVGETYDIRVIQNSGASQTTLVTSSDLSYLDVTFLGDA